MASRSTAAPPARFPHSSNLDELRASQAGFICKCSTGRSTAVFTYQPGIKPSSELTSWRVLKQLSRLRRIPRGLLFSCPQQRPTPLQRLLFWKPETERATFWLVRASHPAEAG